LTFLLLNGFLLLHKLSHNVQKRSSLHLLASGWINSRRQSIWKAIQDPRGERASFNLSFPISPSRVELHPLHPPRTTGSHRPYLCIYIYIFYFILPLEKDANAEEIPAERRKERKNRSSSRLTPSSDLATFTSVSQATRRKRVDTISSRSRDEKNRRSKRESPKTRRFDSRSAFLFTSQLLPSFSHPSIPCRSPLPPFPLQPSLNLPLRLHTSTSLAPSNSGSLPTSNGCKTPPPPSTSIIDSTVPSFSLSSPLLPPPSSGSYLRASSPTGRRLSGWPF